MLMLTWQDLETRKRAPLYQKKQEEELRAAGEKAAEAELRAQEAELRYKEAKVLQFKTSLMWTRNDACRNKSCKCRLQRFASAPC